ncbi:MAG: sulfite exporter TauE/SafE family protein [Gemmatimonadaceae bacterium]|nr:sulfite exporter TauE/SafE family protein [Gemmatimonadaceae bacterium]
MADLPQLAGVMVASLLGGAANSVAGGGTLLTFPALVGLGVPMVAANATSTVALWPGSLSSMLGYRDALRGVGTWARVLVVPSLLGGALGAWLLTRTSDAQFKALVPWLVLGATLLFLSQKRVGHWLRARIGATAPELLSPDALPAPPGRWAMAVQFAVAIYGGYFGAGAGIVMLAAFGLLGLTNVHQMNGLKNIMALLFNFVAIVTFAASGLVQWPIAAVMAVGSIAGGHVAARVAQRMNQDVMRQLIGLIGIASAVWLFVSSR